MPRVTLLPRALDPLSTDWYPDYQLRLYDRRVAAGTAAGCTSRSSCKGQGSRRAGPLHHELQHFAVPRHLRPSRDDRSLHDAGGRAVAREGRRTNALEAVIHPRGCVPPQLRPARRHQGRRRGAAGVGAELVLRLPEAGEALGAATACAAAAAPASQPPASTTNPRLRSIAIRARADVLPPYRHGAHVARRAEPGAGHGDGPARARAPDDARGASEGELRQRAKEGLDLIPLAPKTEMDLERGLAPVAHHQAAQARHRPCARSARRRDGGAGAVDEHPAREAAARRVAPRRLPDAGQFALTLEVPAGGLLHLRVGGDPAAARRRRRARRAGDRPCTKASISDASSGPAGEAARGVLAAASGAARRQRRRAGAA